jgi:hypothetical protein
MLESRGSSNLINNARGLLHMSAPNSASANRCEASAGGGFGVS